MEESEEAEMRAGLDAGEPGLSRMIKLSYRVLGLNSFLTVGEDETRAWTVNIGALAPRLRGLFTRISSGDSFELKRWRMLISSTAERWLKLVTGASSVRKVASTLCKTAISSISCSRCKFISFRLANSEKANKGTP